MGSRRDHAISLEGPVRGRAKRRTEAEQAYEQRHFNIDWLLDVNFDEDRARNRGDHGPENLATLRKPALNALRSARPDISIRRKRSRWSDEFAKSVLGQMR